MAKVIIEIVVDKKTGALKVAGQEMKALGDKAQTAAIKTKQATSSLSSLTQSLGGFIAGAAVIGFFKQSISAAIQQEDAVNKLNAALKIQGNFTNEASQELQNYASELQKTTRFGDETIIKGQALLASFGLQGEQLKRTTQAALDLATATGTDLNAAFLLLGKAAKGETGSLSRFGIILAKGIPEAEKLDAALKEINNSFGGAAQADVKTFGGALAQLQGLFGDVTEEIGKGLFPALTNLGSATKDSLPFIQNVGLAIAGVIGLAITGIKSVVDILTQAVNVAITIIEVFISGLTAQVRAVVDIVRALLSGNINEARARLGSLASEIGEIASKASDEIGAAGKKVVEDAEKNQATLKETFAATFGEIAELNEGKNQRVAVDDAQQAGIRAAKKKAEDEAEAAAAAEKEEKLKGDKQRLAEEFIELDQGKFEADQLRLENELAALEAKGIREFEIIENGVTRKVGLEELRQAKMKVLLDDENKRIKAAGKKDLDREKKLQKEREKLNTQRLAATKGILQNINTVAEAAGEEGKAIAKATAIGIAVQDTFVAANKALASAPPPFNFVLAATVVAAGIANVAKITSAQRGATGSTGDEFLVGERGPELIRLGGPARIEANRDLRTRLQSIERSPGAGGSISIVFEGGINIAITAANFNDPDAIEEIMLGIAERMQDDIEVPITLALRTVRLARLNEERAD